jgi:abortive infection alpha-like protein
MTNELIPISDEQARAIQEVAKTTGTALDLVEKAGAYIGWVLGTVPADLAGVLGGDWLAQVRIRNLAWYRHRTEEILRARGVAEPAPVSPSLAIPLLRAAADESREELQELWAQLLAAAVDPKRSKLVRRSFISTVSQLDPLDAAVLFKRHEHSASSIQPDDLRFVATSLHLSEQEVEVSVQHLDQLGCVQIDRKDPGRLLVISHFTTTSYGRELIRTCS